MRVSLFRIPRCSLRVLLFVFVPVTALTTWSAVQYRQISSQRQAVAWVTEQNGHISYDYERPTADGSYPVGAKPPGPKLLRDWFGIDAVSGVYGIILDNKEIADLSPLTKLKNLEFLGIFIEIAPDTDITEIAKLKKLRNLDIDYADVDEQQLEEIKAALPDCEIQIGGNARVR